MTFTASAPAGVLAKAFAMAARVSPRSSTAPILQNLLIEARNGGLRITGASPDATITVDVDGDAEGSITAPADKLSAIAARLDAGKPIRFKLEGSQLIATQGRSRYTLPTMDPAAFVGTFAAEVSHGFGVDGETLSAALKAVEGSTDDNATARANLTGVYVDTAKGAPMMVATDSKTLSASPLKTTCPEDAPGVIIHPATFPVVHAMAALSDLVTIEVAASSVALSAAGVRYQSKVIDARFPDWRRILIRDEDRATHVTVAGDDMRGALDRIKAIGESVLHVKFGKAIEIEARNKDKAASGANEIIDAEIEGPGLTIILDGGNLAWAIASLPGAASYVFALNGVRDSVTVSDPARPDEIRLLMPLRG